MPRSNPRAQRSAEIETVLLAAQGATRSLRARRAARNGPKRPRLTEAATRAYTPRERRLLTLPDEPARAAHDRRSPTSDAQSRAARDRRSLTSDAQSAATDVELGAQLAHVGRNRLALGAGVLCAAVALACAGLALDHARALRAASTDADVRAGRATAPPQRIAPPPTRPAAADSPASVGTADASAPPSTDSPAPPAPLTPDYAPTPATLVEWLATARYHDALAGYRELAQSDTSNPAYAAAASILERRLQRRCAQRAEAGGAPCSAEEL